MSAQASDSLPRRFGESAKCERPGQHVRPAVPVFSGRYIWHPAFDDADLTHACVSVRAGTFFEARAVLSATRGDFALRARRSAVLASVAADSDVAERWVAGEPDADALLLAARAAVVRALRAADAEHRRAEQLIVLARAACLRAVDCFPADPTPFVALLSLARLMHWSDPGPDELGDRSGPWPVLAQVQARDPWNREAYHRLLECFYARHGGSHSAMWDVTGWITRRVPSESELRVLELVARSEHVASRRAGQPLPVADPEWTRCEAVQAALHMYEDWFITRGRTYRFAPVADLSYLAYALSAAERTEARHVLSAMGPFAAARPWNRFGDPHAGLSHARRQVGLPTPAP